MKKILLCTNVYGKYKRQDLCIDSIEKLIKKNPNVSGLLIQFENETIEYFNIPAAFKLKRSAKTKLETDKEFPSIKDLFDIAADSSEEIFVYFNSDIILTQQLIKHIEDNPCEAYGISRTELLNTPEKLSDPVAVVRMEPAGYDCWVIDKKWWKAKRDLFPHMFIGRPYFDVIYTAMMTIHSNNHHINNKHLIYHPVHERNSFDEDAVYYHNRGLAENQFDKYRLFWGDICSKTFFKREDWGYFLKFNEDENKTIENCKKEYFINNCSELFPNIIDSRICETQYAPEFEELLEDFKKLNAKNVLEIGSYMGWSLHHWLKYANDGANIISIDLPIEKFCGPQDPRCSQQETAIKTEWKEWSKTYKNKLYLIREPSQDPRTKEQTKIILNEEKLDFLFIDGNHLYEYVKLDLEMYIPLVKKGGIVALHDIGYAEEGGVHKLWDEIKLKYKTKELRLHPLKEKGIGIIYV